nr:MAG TPA: hypothetical protein [Caudoviricetes sp.]DAZ83775.1 MAG TPA: hypothetical protein [Caudoviricetes sp.]
MILLSPGCRVTHQSHVALFYCNFIAEKQKGAEYGSNTSD